jgi:hypothetical protein
MLEYFKVFEVFPLNPCREHCTAEELLRPANWAKKEHAVCLLLAVQTKLYGPRPELERTARLPSRPNWTSRWLTRRRRSMPLVSLGLDPKNITIQGSIKSLSSCLICHYTLSYDSLRPSGLIKNHIVKESYDKVYVTYCQCQVLKVCLWKWCSQKSDRKFCRSRRSLVGLSHHRLCCCRVFGLTVDK